MFTKSSTINSKNQARPSGDSFVIDLREKKPTMIEPKTSRSPGSVAACLISWRKLLSSQKKSQLSRPSFKLSFSLKAPVLSSTRNNHKRLAISVFSGHHRRHRSFFSKYSFWDSPFNKRERRFFAKTVAWRRRSWRHLSTIVSPTPPVKTEYLLSWYRSLFVFLMALIIIVLPIKLLAYFKILDFQGLKNNVISNSLSALDNLAAASDGASQLDLSSASTNFARAAIDFSSAQQELSRVDDWLLTLASFSSDPKIKLAASGKKFLAAGQAAAALGQELSAAGDVFLRSDEDKNWGKLIDSFVDHGERALVNAKELQTQLHAIKADDLPEEYRDQFLSFRSQADMATESLSLLLNSAQEIKNFLGVSQDKRYLLVFQNNSEMRGAGGFLGSYALVDIRDGRVRRLEVPAGGSYDTEAGMKSFIQSPKPLWLVSPRWYFWDANWWPDWPTSARTLMWFYDKSDGPTVDGVISFTPDVLEDLLRITGPIDLQAEYGLTINADNFWDLIQITVEKENLIKTNPEAVVDIPDSPENQPKKIIGDLMAKVMDRLPQVLTTDNIFPLLQALEKNISSKNIMLYFSDATLQAKASRYGLDGAMSASRQDYLMVTHTNIAGQKSDRKMTDEIEHSIQVLADNSLVDTLTITRRHTGIKNEILSGVRNVDWLRVYVPQGSQLLEASGFKAPDAVYFEEPEDTWEQLPFLEQTEGRAQTDLNSGTKIYPENGKTVFANWVMVDPGETVVIKMRYRLPFKLQAETPPPTDNYLNSIISWFSQSATKRFSLSLLIQKQPGARPADFHLSLALPAAWHEVWNYPAVGFWNNDFSLNQDSLRAVLLEK